jgi:hypothetical protein
MGGIRRCAPAPPPPAAPPREHSALPTSCAGAPFTEAGFAEVVIERQTPMLEYASHAEFIEERHKQHVVECGWQKRWALCHCGHPRTTASWRHAGGEAKSRNGGVSRCPDLGRRRSA